MPVTDLKALREQLATEIAGNVAACFVMADGIPANLPQDIDAALKKYALACLGEPSSEMIERGYFSAASANPHDHTVRGMFNAMAAQRMKEIK